MCEWSKAHSSSGKAPGQRRMVTDPRKRKRRWGKGEAHKGKKKGNTVSARPAKLMTLRTMLNKKLQGARAAHYGSRLCWGKQERQFLGVKSRGEGANAAETSVVRKERTLASIRNRIRLDWVSGEEPRGSRGLKDLHKESRLGERKKSNEKKRNRVSFPSAEKAAGRGGTLQHKRGQIIRNLVCG